MKIHWPECEDYPIVLSTESKIYNCDFLDAKTITSPPRKNCAWSTRLKDTLEQIDTEYVLFFLEDFFLGKVQTDIFEKALELIESDIKVGLITFNKRNLGATFPDKPDYDKCFKEQSRKVENRTNVLVGLWRKEYYLKLFYGDENPWEYEKNSNIRSKFAGYKIFTQDYNYSFPAFRYCMNPKDGYGITGGKWLCKNKELFESYGIFNVNYDNLGVFEEQITYEDIQNKSRENNKECKIQRKKTMKKEKLVLQIKEYLYDLYKSVKKTRFFEKIKYYKTCFKYFVYYKKRK